MSWSVFLRDESLPLPIQEIARLAREVTGGVVLDHAQRIRRSYGWIAGGLEEPQAGRLVESLEAGGFPALKKSEDRLVPLEKKFKTHKALLLDEGLSVQADLRGEMVTMPWQELSVVSAGKVLTFQDEKVSETEGAALNVTEVLSAGAFLVTGLPIPTLKTKVKTATKQVERSSVLIHLVFAAADTVIEIGAGEFDYSYLGARLAPTSRENLLLFLGDLRRLAGGAHFTDMTVAFLETGRLGHEFHGEKDFLSFNRWIVEKTVA